MPARPLLLLFFIVLFSYAPVRSFAAIPIKEQKQAGRVQQWYQRVNEAAAAQRSLQLSEPLPEQQRTEKEDSGVYGILSLVFGLLGIFPAAIVLGVIGLEKHRKYRELALTGLILGILTLVLLLLLIGFIFIFSGAFL